MTLHAAIHRLRQGEILQDHGPTRRVRCVMDGNRKSKIHNPKCYYVPAGRGVSSSPSTWPTQ